MRWPPQGQGILDEVGEGSRQVLQGAEAQTGEKGWLPLPLTLNGSSQGDGVRGEVVPEGKLPPDWSVKGTGCHHPNLHGGDAAY